MDVDEPEAPFGPAIPFSQSFYDSLADISLTAYQTALRIFSVVLAASPPQKPIRLRDDQVVPAVHYEEGRDTLYISGTGSGKTMQIITTVLLHSEAITLVMSPLMRLQHTMVSTVLFQAITLYTDGF